MTAPDLPPPLTAPGIHDMPREMVRPPKTQKQLKGAAQAANNLLLANVLYAVSGIRVLGLSPFIGLRSWADELVQRANDAYYGALDAQASANYANGRLTILAGINLAAGVPGGVVVSSDFSGASASSLGSVFSRVSVGSGGGGFGPNGQGHATWKKSGGLPRANYDRNELHLATDYQASQIVVSKRPEVGGNNPNWDAPGGTPYNLMLLRANEAQDSAVYARVGRQRVHVGYIVGGSWTNLRSELSTTADGDNWTFLVGTDEEDRRFILKRNGVPVIDVVDDDAGSQLGEDYRFAGIGAECAAGFFVQVAPGEIDAWAAADRQPSNTSV